MDSEDAAAATPPLTDMKRPESQEEDQEDQEEEQEDQEDQEDQEEQEEEQEKAVVAVHRAKRERRQGSSSATMCEVCSIQLNSSSQAQIHYRGKTHQRRLRRLVKAVSAGVLSQSQVHPLLGSLPLPGRPLQPHFLPLRVTGSSTLSLFPTFSAMDPVQKAVINHTFRLKKKVVISCNVCHLRFNSTTQAEAHYKGHKHGRKLKALETQRNVHHTASGRERERERERRRLLIGRATVITHSHLKHVTGSSSSSQHALQQPQSSLAPRALQPEPPSFHPLLSPQTSPPLHPLLSPQTSPPLHPLLSPQTSPCPELSDPPGDSLPGDSLPGDSPPGDSPPGDSLPGDSPPGDSPPGDSPPGDSLPGDSPPGDSLPGDSPPGDSPPGDSLPGDSPPGDSPPGDSPPGDSLPGDSLPGDSLPGDSPPGDILPGDSPPGDSLLTAPARSSTGGEEGQVVKVDETRDVQRNQKRFVCPTCKVTVNSRSQLDAHCRGSKHKHMLDGHHSSQSQRRVKMTSSARPTSRMKQPMGCKSRAAVSSQAFQCDMCQVSVNSETQLKQHTSSRRHRERVSGKCVKFTPYNKLQPSAMLANKLALQKQLSKALPARFLTPPLSPALCTMTSGPLALQLPPGPTAIIHGPLISPALFRPAPGPLRPTHAPIIFSPY